MEVEKIMRLGRMNLTVGWKSTIRSKDELPKNSIRADQVKPSTTNNQAWKKLDKKFGDQKKLMNGLLNEITNLRLVKSDSTSPSRYAVTILGF